MLRKRPPEPWHSFFRDIDKTLVHPVELRCLGGFAIAMLYGLPRPTVDVDYLTVVPLDETTNLESLAGMGSTLHTKHGVYVQHVGIFTVPDSYEDRLMPMFPSAYYVHPVPLTHDEAEEYFELSKRISMLLAQGADVNDTENSCLEGLLIARARLLGSAQQKRSVLDGVLQNIPPTPLTLFYCGDGRVTDDVSGDEIRQIDAVSHDLFERGWKTCQFTARENLSARRTILDNFRIGDIDALVAIRCLDEGIDIPGCAHAFLLASARNARQFIQRRGRILRKAPGKSRAYIHDFLVYNPFPVTPETVEAERRLMDAELARVNEFANTALNPYDAERAIAEIPLH